MTIFKDGILIEIKVRFWTGTKKLTAEDLGINKEDISDLYNLGKKMLIPKEIIHKFRAIESKARFIIESNSFRYPFGNTRFIPNKKLHTVLSSLTEYQKAYNSLTEELITNYNKLCKRMLPVYEQAAIKAYDRQYTDININEEEFINKYLTRIETFYPKAKSLKNKFSLTWNLFEISLLKNRDSNKNHHELFINHNKKTKEKIVLFLNDVVFSLRNEIILLCQRIIENIINEKTVRGPTISSIKKAIKNFSDKNFIGDKNIEYLLTNLKTDFLEKYKSNIIANDKNLQSELKEKLEQILIKAKDNSTINAVTKLYQDQIQ